MVDHEIGLHDTVATHDIHDLHKTYTYGAGLRDTFIADHEPHAFGATTTTTYGDHGYYGGEHHVYEDVHDLHLLLALLRAVARLTELEQLLGLGGRLGHHVCVLWLTTLVGNHGILAIHRSPDGG